MTVGDDQREKKTRRPTRDDVAKRAGVSSAVVSYVLNNGPRRVAPDTKDRVVRAIAELSYVPNDIARSLAGRRTRTVGLIAPSLAHPVWARLSMGISAVLREEASLLIVCDVEESRGQDAEFAAMLASKRVDGVVLVPTSNSRETISVLHDAHLPVVVVEQRVEYAPSVVVDPIVCGRLVTEHLLDLGHTRIGVLRERRTSLDSWMRFSGYELALNRASIRYDEGLVADAAASVDGSIVDGSIEAAAKLLQAVPRPTAIFAHNDLMAIAVIHVARQMGLRVPLDLSVVGIDDVEAARYISPPLTTLPFPAFELGRIAALRLVTLMRGRDGEHHTALTPPDLIVRGSTAPPPPR